MSDYETIQRRRNIIVGIFVIIALITLGWMVFKFGGLPKFVSKYTSYQVSVQFPTAPGVQENTPVRFCGYQIGRVTDIERPKIMRDLNTNKYYHQTLVVLSIDKEFNDIPDNVEAKLMSRGLGSSYIELKLRTFDINEPTGKCLEHGSVLQGSTGMTSEFFPEESQKKLEELVSGIAALVKNANDILGDPQNKQNLRVTLANFTEATEQAGKSLRQFEKLSAAGTKTLENADRRLDEIITSMVDASEQMGTAARQMRLVLEKVNQGEGTAGKLLNDGRLYENLLENSQQLEMLIEELKQFTAASRQKGLPIKLK
jgi:phospholipid/cholesterol/gamma-HCH transport system substrate-binding protein